jgi:hypothetical protein
MEVQSSINNSNFDNKFNSDLVFAEVHSLNKEKQKSQRIRNSYNQKMDISKDEQTTNITSMYNSQFVNGLNNNFNMASSRRGKLSQSGIENYSKKMSNSFKPKTAHTFESHPSQNVPTNPESTTNLANQNLYQDIKISDPKYFSQVVSLPPKYIETVKEPLYLNANTIAETKQINKDTQLQKSIGSTNSQNLAHSSYKSPQKQNEQIIRDSINIYNQNNPGGNNIKIDSVKILEPKYINAAGNISNDYNFDQSNINQDGVKVLPVKYLKTKVRPVKYIDSEQAKDINNIYNMLEGEEVQSNYDLDDKNIYIEGEEKTQFCGISDILSNFVKKICG